MAPPRINGKLIKQYIYQDVLGLGCLPVIFPIFVTYLKWTDYLSSNPESLYQAMRLFSDLGTPYGFRYIA